MHSVLYEGDTYGDLLIPTPVTLTLCLCHGGINEIRKLYSFAHGRLIEALYDC